MPKSLCLQINFNMKIILRFLAGSGRRYAVVSSNIFSKSFSSKPDCTAGNDLVGSLPDILALKNKNYSTFFVDGKIKAFIQQYERLNCDERDAFLNGLATTFEPNAKNILVLVQKLLDNQGDTKQVIRFAEKIKSSLIPNYLWFFTQIGRVENGVKFLVDLRTSVIDCISKLSILHDNYEKMQVLDANLKELLSLWFSAGFLKLERITWNSPCALLQKISDYEAIHRVRSWMDLKRRVGPYRRCFAFTHASMPGEPIVVLHTALMGSIASKISEITAAVQSGENQRENFNGLKAVTFYSIFSTQRGLKGIDMGNHMIKLVVREIQAEVPEIVEFSTLSPIPNFRQWLYDRMKKPDGEVFSPEEAARLEALIGTPDLYPELKALLARNEWMKIPGLAEALETPLMRLCARYLYQEKKRGYALNSVGK